MGIGRYQAPHVNLKESECAAGNVNTINYLPSASRKCLIAPH